MSVFAIALTGCGGGGAADDSLKVEGTIRAPGGDIGIDSPCGDGRAGMTIVVYDADDKKVGITNLGVGMGAESPYADYTGAVDCIFDFSVEVQEGDIFSIEVGGGGRYSFSKAEADDLALSL